MIKMNSTFTGKYFTSEVPDVSFSIGSSRARVTVKVTKSGTTETIYDEYLYPIDGNIELSEPGRLLEPFALRSLVLATAITIVEERVTSENNVDNITTVDTKNLSATVYYSAAETGWTAQDFSDSYFLSIFQGTRRTALGREEYLHYYGTDSARVVAEYDDNTTRTFNLQAEAGDSDYRTIRVSPSLFAVAGLELQAYTVSAGQRSQRYDVMAEALDCAPILVFTNSFGVQEVAYCTGLLRKDSDYTRSAARLGKMRRNYQITEQRKFSADSGVLTFPEANWLDELFRSQEVYICTIDSENGLVPGKEVIITDSKSGYTNDDAELPRFTFTYEYAQRNHNVLQLDRPGRIFDYTFDHTFN